MPVCNYVSSLSGRDRLRIGAYLSLLYAEKLLDSGDYYRAERFAAEAVRKLAGMAGGINQLLSVVPEMAALINIVEKAGAAADLVNAIEAIKEQMSELREAIDKLDPYKVRPDILPSDTSNLYSEINEAILAARGEGLITDQQASELKKYAELIKDIPAIKKALQVIRQLPAITSKYSEILSALSSEPQASRSPYEIYSELAERLDKVSREASRLAEEVNNLLGSIPRPSTSLGRAIVAAVSNALGGLAEVAGSVSRVAGEASSAYKSLADFMHFLEKEYNPSSGVYPGLEPYHSRLVGDIANVIEEAYQLLRESEAIKREERLAAKLYGANLEGIKESLDELSNLASSIGESLLSTIDNMYEDLGSANNDLGDVFREAAKQTGYVLPPIETSPVKDLDRFIRTWIERFQAAGGYWAKQASNASGAAKILREALSALSYAASYLAQLVPTPSNIERAARSLEEITRAILERNGEKLRRLLHEAIPNPEALAGLVITGLLTSLALSKITSYLAETSPRIAGLVESITSFSAGDPLGLVAGIARTLESRNIASISATILEPSDVSELSNHLEEVLESEGISKEAARSLAKEITDKLLTILRTAKKIDIGRLSDELEEAARKLGVIDTSSLPKTLADDIESLSTLLDHVRRQLRMVTESLSIPAITESEALGKLVTIASTDLDTVITEGNKILERIETSLKTLSSKADQLGLKQVSIAVRDLLNRLDEIASKGRVSDYLAKLLDAERKLEQSIDEARREALETLSEAMRDIERYIEEHPGGPEARYASEALDELVKVYDKIKNTSNLEELSRAIAEAESKILEASVTPSIIKAAEAIEKAAEKLLGSKEVRNKLLILINLLRRRGEAVQPVEELEANLESIESRMARQLQGIENKAVAVPSDAIKIAMNELEEVMKKYPDTRSALSEIYSFLRSKPYLTIKDVDKLSELITRAATRLKEEGAPADAYEALSSISELIAREAYNNLSVLVEELSKIKNADAAIKDLEDAIRRIASEYKISAKEAKELRAEASTRIELLDQVIKDIDTLEKLIKSIDPKEAARLEEAKNALIEAQRTGTDIDKALDNLVAELKRVARKSSPGVLRVLRHLVDVLKRGTKEKEYLEIAKSIKELETELSSAKAALVSVNAIAEKLAIEKAPREALEDLLRLAGNWREYSINGYKVSSKLDLVRGEAILRYHVSTPDGSWIEIVYEFRPTGKNSRVVIEKVIVDPDLVRKAPSPKVVEEIEEIRKIVAKDPLVNELSRVIIATSNGETSLGKLILLGAQIAANTILGAILQQATKPSTRLSSPELGIIESRLGIHPVAITYPPPGTEELDLLVLVTPDQYSEILRRLPLVIIRSSINGENIVVSIPYTVIDNKRIGFIPSIPKPQKPVPLRPSIKPQQVPINLPGTISNQPIVGPNWSTSEKTVQTSKQSYTATPKHTLKTSTYSPKPYQGITSPPGGVTGGAAGAPPLPPPIITIPLSSITSAESKTSQIGEVLTI